MKPLTEKRSLAGHGRGLVFGLSAMQGWRPTMEDAHCAVGAVPGLADHAFFAVFDGHGGARVAHFLASRMLERVRATNEFAEYAAARSRPRPPNAAPRQAGVERLCAAVRVAFAACDAELERGGWAAREGSTANVVFVTPSHVICASAGDTRACLLTRAGASELSSDHRPDTPAETARIRAAGGIVYHRRVLALDTPPGGRRETLGVSRAFGDFAWKSAGARSDVGGQQPLSSPVTAEPELRVWKRDAAGDEGLVIACDGVWDVCSNADAHALLARELRAGAQPETAAASLIERCLAKGSTDNMSAIVVRFTGEANGAAASSTANTVLRSSAPEEDEDDEVATFRADDAPPQPRPRATGTAHQPSGGTLVRPFDIDAPAGLRARKEPGASLRSAWS